jgi:tRNA(Ile)-lysidine synthase
MRVPARAVLAAAVVRAGEAFGGPLRGLLARAGHGADSPIVVAVSGGADSVAALLAACAVVGPDRVVAAHLNHALRGRASEGDAVFVRALARALGARCRMARWRARDRAALGEEGARRVRLAFLARVARGVGSSCVVVGHHARDVAESQLMALARGAPAWALAAPRAVSQVAGCVLVRPLLERCPEEIRGVLREARVPWREDASNAGRGFTRNRLRHDVVPAWRAAVPQEAWTGVVRTRRLAEEDEAAFAVWLEQAGVRVDGPTLASRVALPVAAWRRALRAWLDAQGAWVGVTVQDAVVQSLASGGSGAWSCGEGERLVVDGGVLWRETRPLPPVALCEVNLPVGGSVAWGAGFVGCEVVELDEAWRGRLARRQFDPSREVLVDVPLQPRPVLRVRGWRPGDVHHPLGAPGRSKLQDQFINRRIPAGVRRSLPVVLLGATILWCPGLPPAESARVLPGRQRALRLTYCAEAPRSSQCPARIPSA